MTKYKKNYNMNILLLGSGGREHAIAWKIAQSPKVDQLFIAPGNAGTALVGTNVNIKADDFPAIKDFALANHIGMVVVGPEDPLVKGVYDYFKNDAALAGIPVIGPSKEGAQLEGSKDFAKAFMMRHNIPTARYKSISAGNLEEGYAFLEELQAPYVLKADGLAAGKGVLILDTLEEAKKELGDMLGGMFGDASKTVVIEEFLDGIECSVFVMTDGESYKVLPGGKRLQAYRRRQYRFEYRRHGSRVSGSFCRRGVYAESGRAHYPPDDRRAESRKISTIRVSFSSA